MAVDKKLPFYYYVVMKISSFPKIKLSLPNAANGWHVVVCNHRDEATRVFFAEPLWQENIKSFLCFVLGDESNGKKVIDVMDLLEKNNISFPLIQRARYSIFLGKVEGGIFQSDSAAMFKGRLAGG